MSDEMMAAIDGWIADQLGYVSGQEAVRQLVARSLEQIEGRDAASGSIRAEAGIGGAVRTAHETNG